MFRGEGRGGKGRRRQHQAKVEGNFGWSFFRCSVENNVFCEYRTEKVQNENENIFTQVPHLYLNFFKKRRRLLKIKSLEFAKPGVYEGGGGRVGLKNLRIYVHVLN